MLLIQTVCGGFVFFPFKGIYVVCSSFRKGASEVHVGRGTQATGSVIHSQKLFILDTGRFTDKS